MVSVDDPTAAAASKHRTANKFGMSHRHEMDVLGGEIGFGLDPFSVSFERITQREVFQPGDRICVVSVGRELNRRCNSEREPFKAMNGLLVGVLEPSSIGFRADVLPGFDVLCGRRVAFFSGTVRQ